MQETFSTPILFIIFNRLDTTKQVFKTISDIKPKFLYVAADGPRDSKSEEKEKCEVVRQYIINNIDWPCEVKTLFRDTNLGCKMAVSGAIDWFFKNEEQGIILEDDCLPDNSFFKYCEDLLNFYKNNNSVFMISGDNFVPQSLLGKESYYFSKIPHIWGWASWRRAWKYYDVDMTDFAEWSKKIKNIWEEKYVINYWSYILKETYKGKIETWDYQWNYAIWKNNGIVIDPRVNLISNIGFGSGTHTFNKNDINSNLKRYRIEFPIIYQKELDINSHADNYENVNFILANNFKFKLKKILKKIGLFKITKKFLYKF